LEARGLVARSRGQDDRRQVVCRITPAGLKLLKQMDRPVDEAVARALGGLTDTELTRLIRILAKVRELNRAP
ncbi:MAG: MarR family winged helix-turn-helix transcriptional regulator, partial [Gemmatimonadales bacterium]